MSEPALTPMMAQYQAMRRSLPADIILFYRLGDFYAEQTSEPVAGKLVSREIARILTPGSIDDESLLDNQRPNYLAAVCRHGKSAGLACIDHTTGEFTLVDDNGEVLSGTFALHFIEDEWELSARW